MDAAVAFRDDPDARRAAREAATEAQASLAAGVADVALVFHTGALASEQVRDGLRDALGPAVPLLGGHAVGAITNDRFGYAGHELALGLIRGGGPRIAAEAPLGQGEAAVGAALGRELRTAARSAAPLLLLYDSIHRTAAGMQLNMAAPLLAGLESALGQLPPVVGAGLAGDMQGSPTEQLAGEAVLQQAALGLSFDATVTMEPVVLHGCQPASDYMTVTRVDGATILELDHRPAVEVIRERIGDALPPNRFGFFITLGVNLGDKWAPYDEAQYVNRLCLKSDRKRGGLILFEADIEEGAEVQLMHRAIDVDDIAPRIDAAFAALGADRRPVFALYIDCAGRAAAYAGMDREDARFVQQAVAGRVPLLGFYSGVEIGPVQGRSRPLDWTGVFCLFSVAAR